MQPSTAAALQEVATQQAATLAAVQLSTAEVLQGLQLGSSSAEASAAANQQACLAARGAVSAPQYSFQTGSGVGVTALAVSSSGSRRRLAQATIAVAAG